MADVMVTARMTQHKKESANQVFESLGTNPSQAINGLYDYVIQNKKLPFGEKEKLGLHKYTAEQISEAASFVDSLVLPGDNRFVDVADAETKQGHLAAQNLM